MYRFEHKYAEYLDEKNKLPAESQDTTIYNPVSNTNPLEDYQNQQKLE